MNFCRLTRTFRKVIIEMRLWNLEINGHTEVIWLIILIINYSEMSYWVENHQSPADSCRYACSTLLKSVSWECELEDYSCLLCAFISPLKVILWETGYRKSKTRFIGLLGFPKRLGIPRVSMSRVSAFE